VVKARRRFGQHFLEPAWVQKLVTAIAPQPIDTFIEIGPGRGAITEPLAARVSKLVAIEVDRDLAQALAARHLPGVQVMTADVLDVDLVQIADAIVADAGSGPAVSPLRVVGNLPYNISSPILFRLLAASASRRFVDATLMLQQEVAERLTAKPSTGEYGVLTLSTAIWADVTMLLALPAGAFRPMPKVRSAVVRLTFRPPPASVTRPDALVQIVRSVFTQRRKTLANALAPFATARGLGPSPVLEAAGIDGQRRPETLSLDEYARLTDVVFAT
jgi:16S rRNA (adenine1518-N6/adenine1519-N6)-dimethyltransferase